MLATNTAMETTGVFQALCRASGKWGLFLSFDADTYYDKYVAGRDVKKHDEIALATNKRLTISDTQIMIEGQAYFFFDTEDELYEAFDDIVGDDGPTKRNDYSGDLRVYALTCNASGELESENT